MIQCKECGFMVSELMRFAIMKNVCPSCGSGLLSDRDSSIISFIQGRLSGQRFASGLTESTIYDISLYLFNELKGGFRDIAIELASAKKSKSNSRRPISEDEISHEEFDEPSEDEDVDELEDIDFSSIRREVESEFSDQLEPEETNPSSIRNEDSLSKAERLKKLYEQRTLANGGSFDRVMPTFKKGFKGITRST